MRERGERREKNQTLNENYGLLLKMPKLKFSVIRVTKWGNSVFFGLQNGGGGGGVVYIGHPMCETTRKPNILANTRDKEVINQNKVGWH